MLPHGCISLSNTSGFHTGRFHPVLIFESFITMSAIRRVAILFAGGPAPAANAVISSAAFSLINAGIEVIGIKHGYSNLIDFDPAKPLEEGKHYIKFTLESLEFMRTEPGIRIGTA